MFHYKVTFSKSAENYSTCMYMANLCVKIAYILKLSSNTQEKWEVMKSLLS